VNPTDNPLLQPSGLPDFAHVAPEHVEPAVRQLLADAERRIAELEANVAPTWDAIVPPLDDIGRAFEQTWGPVNHLFGVKNSEDLRTAREAVLPDVVSFGLRMCQSEPIYKAIKGLREGPDWPTLNEAQQRIIERKLLTAELAGIGLAGEQRERFNTIARELSKLGSDFSNHVLDATKAWELIIRDPADADGLPDSLRRITAQSFNEKNPDAAPQATPEAGPWRITLDVPVSMPFLKHCRNRDLREQVYRAYMTRASRGDWDNAPVCVRILQLRREQADLLGYKSFADMSLAEKMAPDVDAVIEMLEKLRVASWDAANSDMQEIHELAIASGDSRPPVQWDVAFWAERLREQRFKFSDEELRPYFPHERVLQGLFDLIQRLFGVQIQPADDEASRWHPDVRYFKVLDESGRQLAGFFYDPYSRPENKRGGAWMDDCLSRRRINGHLQVPVAHLVCNGTPPAGGKPALMTFREVETLFHEFGHGLQHMLTRVDFPDAAGISGVEWDAVELPSQFMENWCYHRPTLMGMTAHFESGEPLPDELFEKICAARTFRAGSDMLRQLTFGMTDIDLHTRFDPDGSESIFDAQRRIMEKTAVLPMLPDDRSLCSFQHIFAGGYAAGYYSYKWAEVLSADAFGAFEEAGLDNDAAVREVGKRFRETVLALGGGRHPMDVFRDFRGRDPDPQALLRQYGLA
jgi:oligopeptidase A